MSGEAEWWYVQDGERRGPVAAFDLEARILAGEIDAATQAWRKGMSSWAKLGETVELSPVLSTLPPPIAKAPEHKEIQTAGDAALGEKTGTTSKKRGRSWLLWWQIDYAELETQVSQYETLSLWNSAHKSSAVLLLFSSILTAIFTYFLLFNLDSYSYADAGVMTVLAIFIYFGHRWAMIAAMILWTVEKALILVGYVAPNVVGNATPTFHAAYQPFLQVLWWCIYMDAFYLAFRVEQKRRRETSVIGPSPTQGGRILKVAGGAVLGSVGLLIVLVVGGVSLLGTNVSAVFATSSNNGPSVLPATRWTNPLTNSSMFLPAGWHVIPRQPDDQPNIYTFSDKNAVVILGAEQYSEGNLGDYVSLLLNNAKYGIRDDQGLETDSAGVYRYTAEFHEAVGSMPVKVHVKVWQGAPGTFWRSVAMWPANGEEERRETEAVAYILERTTE